MTFLWGAGGWVIVDRGLESLDDLAISHTVPAKAVAAISSYGLDPFARGRGVGTSAIDKVVSMPMCGIGF